MYHAIVRQKIRALFDAVSKGDAEPVLTAFAPRFEHRFIGEDHALGGARQRLDLTREWYARLYRLMPDIQFDLERIDVSGTPWNTTIIVDWKETNSGTDGVVTDNRGIHAINLQWGKATRVVICPHTDGLRKTLDRLFAAGVAEAHAAPIIG